MYVDLELLFISFCSKLLIRGSSKKMEVDWFPLIDLNVQAWCVLEQQNPESPLTITNDKGIAASIRMEGFLEDWEETVRETLHFTNQRNDSFEPTDRHGGTTAHNWIWRINTSILDQCFVIANSQRRNLCLISVILGLELRTISPSQVSILQQ